MTNTKPMLNSSLGDAGAPDRCAADQRSRDSRRMNGVAAWLLLLVTPLLMAVVGWHTVKLYYLMANCSRLGAAGEPARIRSGFLPRHRVCVVDGWKGIPGTRTWILASGGTNRHGFCPTPLRLSAFPWVLQGESLNGIKSARGTQTTTM